MNKRLAFSLIAFVIWTAITVIGGRIQTQGVVRLDEGVSRGIGWNFVAASVFILGIVLWQRWTDVKLCKPKPWSSVWLAWLPLLYIVVALGLAIAFHLPPLGVLVWVFLNSILVGFSEELMFRGVLLQAFRNTISIWPAVLLTSFVFGAIHSLNVFTTGNLKQSLIQSGAAFLSGLIFIALRLRTGSLWPSIILHGVWDFSVFTLSKSVSSGSDTHDDLSGIAMFTPVFLVLPNALYGLWLMRNISKTHSNPDI